MINSELIRYPVLSPTLLRFLVGNRINQSMQSRGLHRTLFTRPTYCRHPYLRSLFSVCVVVRAQVWEQQCSPGESNSGTKIPRSVSDALFDSPTFCPYLISSERHFILILITRKQRWSYIVYLNGFINNISKSYSNILSPFL
jgi:hypothetical protein